MSDLENMDPDFTDDRSCKEKLKDLLFLQLNSRCCDYSGCW